MKGDHEVTRLRSLLYSLKMFIFSSLIEKFKTVKNFPSPQGKRHQLHIVLSISTISVL